MSARKLTLCAIAAALSAPVVGDGNATDASAPLPGSVCVSPRATNGARSGIQPFTADTIPAAAPTHLNSLPPVLTGMGDLHMPITTASVQAQAYFDQGLSLAYAFNHAEARQAFRAAQYLDPNCAMCWWGEAFVLGPNINAPMAPEAVAPAMTAMRRAQGLADRVSEREQALIAALSRRYTGDAAADRAPLDAAWADAMRDIALHHPADDTLQVIYAEAVMNLSPWDYWMPGGERPKGRAGDMLRALERVLVRNPDHPGAIHLYIHAVEASATPERALPYAERLAALAPAAGHLVHMPAHIYFRLGMYRESLHANVDAVAADERYFVQSASDPFYRNGYYPHNLHFLMASAQRGGNAELAIAAARKLDRVIESDVVRVAPVLQPVKGAPYLVHATFSTPETVLALPEPGEDLSLVRAYWHYARALAHAARGEIGAGMQEVSAIAALAGRPDLRAMETGGVPAGVLLRIASNVAEARLDNARGDVPAAITAYRRAIDLQDSLPYMEPPYWYYPVRQSLGALFLKNGDPAAAAQAFRESLQEAPNNAWALFGLQQATLRMGDGAAAAEISDRLEKAWFGGAEVPDMGRL